MATRESQSVPLVQTPETALMNPLHALDLLASEANALLETYLGAGAAISPHALMLSPGGDSAGFRSVLIDAPAREEQLAVFRESDGADWTDSDEG